MPQANIDLIREKLGIPKEMEATGERAKISELLSKRFKPLTRQHVRSLLDKYAAGGIGFKPDTPCLHLQKYTWLDRLDPDTVPDLLARFASTAATWRRLLADYSPSAAFTDSPPPPHSTAFLPV